MNFLEAPILVAEVASLAVGAELLPVELPAILRLILVICTLFLSLAHVQWVVLAQLFNAVCELTLGAIPAHSCLSPVLAELTLVHRSLYKAFLSGVS